MTNKWHINKHGVPAPCKAKEGNCPLGGDESHFSTKIEAQTHADKEMEKEFGLLPNHDKERAEKIKARKKLAEVIGRMSNNEKTTGFKYETYASLVIAEELGLEKISIYENNELLITIKRDEDKPDNEVVVNYDIGETSDVLAKYYESVGSKISDKTKLVRVLHHSSHNDNVLVQSGGPNVLDAAVIKAGEVVDIIEMKELSRQAQLPTEILQTDKYGYVKEESLVDQEDYMKDVLKDVKIQDADGTDLQLDFGSEENNKRLPLKHFVKKYREKGATSFIYTTNNGEDVHRVDLTGNPDEVVDRLIENDIKANVRLRANLSERKVSNDDIYRFNNLLSKEYFKSGRASKTESFTLKSIREDKIMKSGKYVRVGGYILPIKYDNYKEHLNKNINKKDMKAFNLTLAGNIKVHY